MLNLSQTEYLPTLAPNYRWNWTLDNDGGQAISLLIVHTSVFGDVKTVAKGWVNLETAVTDEAIRAMVIKKANNMMGTYRPWNPVGADQVKRVMTSLETPKDAEYPSDDGEYGPRVSHEIKIAKAQF